jgi:cell wall assembly regulator SMI1
MEKKNMRELWNRIEAWLADNAPSLLEDLRPGASQYEIDQTERLLGVQFSDDMKESYFIHNGQLGEFEGLVGIDDYFCNIGFSLLSLKDIIYEWKEWKDLLDAGEAYWNPYWIPFAANLTGNCFCLDFDSFDQIYPGQIIFVDHERTEEKIIVSSCFYDFLERFADKLERNCFVFHEDCGLIWRE